MTVATERKLSFEETTDPEVIEYTHTVNAATWKYELTVPDYCERERILGSSGIATKGASKEMKKRFPVGHELFGLKYFVLKDNELDASSKTSQIVVSCEALCRLGYAIHPNSDGQVVPILTVCVGAVFTAPEHRGNGLARVMIHSLNEYYDKLGADPNAPDFVKNTIINLYSEVGEYYAKNGYHSLHVPLHVVTDPGMLLDQYCSKVLKESGRTLGFDDYGDLVDLQKKQFESRLKRLHEEQPQNFIFTVAADFDIYQWFMLRDQFLRDKTQKHREELKFGVALKDNSHIIWHHLWSGKTLVILKVFMDDDQSSEDCENTLRQLISHAIVEMKECGLTSLEFWDEEIPIKKFPDLYSVLSDMKHSSKLFEKNDSLSAMKPPRGYEMDRVTWDNNTKFCWF